MNSYEESKKVRRVAAVIYLLVMAFLVGGTYLSQQKKAEAERKSGDLNGYGESFDYINE